MTRDWTEEHYKEDNTDTTNKHEAYKAEALDIATKALEDIGNIPGLEINDLVEKHNVSQIIQKTVSPFKSPIGARRRGYNDI